MDVGGTYCGMNAISHNLIIANRKNLINGNGFILGVSGSGKSFFTKREIVSLFLGTNDEIIIADPQNEYTSLVNALGGAAINLSPTSPNHINAMDLALGYGDSENPLIAKSEFVLSFIEQIMARASLKRSTNLSLTAALPTSTRRIFLAPIPFSRRRSPTYMRSLKSKRRNRQRCLRLPLR